MASSEKSEPGKTISEHDLNSEQSDALFCEYVDCRFRFDINVSSTQRQVQSGEHEILMELSTKDGHRKVFNLDINVLTFLHEQLEKVESAFPRCYVYKK